MNPLHFWLNDREQNPSGISPTTTVLRYLRDHLFLTGTKEGCAEGDCGACTVAVLEPNPAGGSAWRSVNACLLLLPMVQGKRVYTVEGIGDSGHPHLSQAVLTEKLGSQCGYCTPGVVMSLFEACYRTDLDAPWKLEDQLSGNLCRCTGYRPIRDAARALGGTRLQDGFSALQDSPPASDMALSYATARQSFFTPRTLAELWPTLAAHPDARMVTGGTDLALDITKRYQEPACLISLEALAELKVFTAREENFELGAAGFLSDLETFANRELPVLGRMLRYFGARQIKNRATLGGNLCTASPIGDLAPVFLALGGEAIALSSKGERRIPMDRFFTGYRKTGLLPGEVLARVEVPRPSTRTRLGAYKVSKRRELDISTVSAAFAVDVATDGTVRSARLAFGGMAETPARALKAEAGLLQNGWTANAVESAADALAADFTPLSDHRGSAAYRLAVAQNLLRGFFEETAVDHSPSLPHLHTSTVQVR